MQENSLSWAVVDDIAARLGAKPDARKKWRQEGRRVPHSWRIRITEALMASGVPVALRDFDALEANPGRIAA